MHRSLLAALAFAAIAGSARAQDAQYDLGIPELRALNPSLTGSGITVIQAEAQATDNNDWEVDPSSTGQPLSKFVYISGSGTSTDFPNDLGISSGHAGFVGDNFYGDTNTADPEGVAYGVSQIYNYEADYFVNDIIIGGSSALPAEIVNQSFIAVTDTGTQALIEEAYDNYADTYGTLFVSGAGNGGLVDAPASAYNGIAVGSDNSGSSSGTYDGRSKPDIVAVSLNPGGETSYTTPLVSGAAALLLQAAQDGDAGSSPQTESDASDARVLKALLLNGATKPAGWKSTVPAADYDTTPLDPITGAGILNVYNSYQNLIAGEHSYSTSLSGPVQYTTGGAVEPDEGWDLNTLTNSFSNGAYVDQSNHYLFDLSASAAPEFTLTATLIWWRELDQTEINNLYLYLFDTDTGQTVACSISTIDNTQEIYCQDLAPGDYDLAVVKSGSNAVSTSDTYALAFNFAPVPEPSAGLLLAPGIAILCFFSHRKLQARKRGVV
ncbi:MAG: S8 family serine peptidase [Chthoniobacteraceae bacterium]|jgi:hypothetical protein